ncbi:hypothetical protein ADK58_25195 [Streptomyces sp. XY152]|nr:hypothetical protein ADK58_25195 [Streptomyces sp. XY152]
MVDGVAAHVAVGLGDGLGGGGAGQAGGAVGVDVGVLARVVDQAEDVAGGVSEVGEGLPPVVMEFSVPAGSRRNPVSTPFVPAWTRS